MKSLCSELTAESCQSEKTTLVEQFDVAETRFQRREFTDYSQNEHEVIRQLLDDQHYRVNPVDDTSKKLNEVDTIKTKLEYWNFTLGTFDIYTLESHLRRTLSSRKLNYTF